MTLTKARRQGLLVGLVGVLLGGTVTFVGVNLSGDQNPAATADDAQRYLALCQIQLDTAQTVDEQRRAMDCIADMTRVIHHYETPPPPTPTPTAPPTPGPARWPTAATAGVASIAGGWVPKSIQTGDLHISTAGTVIEDVRITGTLFLETPDVIVRRVEVIAGNIKVAGVACRGYREDDGTTTYPLIDTVTISRGSKAYALDPPAIDPGGYVARNVAIMDRPEGFRVGGFGNQGCGPVVIEDSYVRITAPDNCTGWHGDGLQGYDGNAVTVANTTIDFQKGKCGGTSPFFVPDGQGNTRADIDGLLVKGGGYTFRLGVPATVKNLRIVADAWTYGPILVKCSDVSVWEAALVTLAPDGQPTVVRAQDCNTENGR